MKLQRCGAVLAAMAIMMSGCEWDSNSSEFTWNDSMSWANFNGIYRSGSPSSPLVSNFSLASGGTAGTEDDTTSETTETAVADQVGETIDAFFTAASGTIPYMNRGTSGWSIKPGSIDITLGGSLGSVGTFTDGGSGLLTGFYELVSGGGAIAASGTVDYDTGAWSITLDPSSPFLEEAGVTYSYVVVQDLGASGGTSTGDDEEPPTSHGWVYTLQIEQTGNMLRLIDNRGFVWEGQMTSLTTPGGDESGLTTGQVIGTFEARGVTDDRYQINGTFSGENLVASGANPSDAASAGLTERRLQGIWMEPTGIGDLYGVTTDVTVQSTTN